MNANMAQLVRSDEHTTRWKYASHLLYQGHSRESALTAADGDLATFSAEWVQEEIQVLRKEIGLADGDGPVNLPELWRIHAYVQYQLLDLCVIDIDEVLAEGGSLSEEDWEELHKAEERFRDTVATALAHPELWTQ